MVLNFKYERLMDYLSSVLNNHLSLLQLSDAE